MCARSRHTAVSETLHASFLGRVGGEEWEAENAIVMNGLWKQGERDRERDLNERVDSLVVCNILYFITEKPSHQQQRNM